MKVIADTITDEQIRELMTVGDTPLTGNGFVTCCRMALREEIYHHMGCEPVVSAENCGCQEDIVRRMRSRCAEIWNARHGDKS